MRQPWIVFNADDHERPDWIVRTATLWPAQPTHEPPQLEDMLNEIVHHGYEVVGQFHIHPDPTFGRVVISARKRSQAATRAHVAGCGGMSDA